jgi:hypothetical protein
MTSRIALTAAAALLSLTLAPAAHAQAQMMPHFGISAGASIPQSSFGDGVNTGYNVNGIVNVGIPLSPLGFRGEVGWNRFDLSGNTASGNVRMVNGAVNVVLAPSTIMTAKPYFIAGLGVYNVKTTGNSGGGILGGGLTTSTADTRLGFNGGIGFAFGLGSVGTLLEARYVTVNSSNNSGSLSFVPISFGITF